MRHLEVGGCSHPPNDPYFTDGKIKVQGGDLPKASQISSRVKTQPKSPDPKCWTVAIVLRFL